MHLARGGADSLTPQCSRLLPDSPLSSRIRVTPAAPPLRGPRTPAGRPRARGPRGFNSGPRFPFKGSRNFPPGIRGASSHPLAVAAGARSEEVRDTSFPGEEARPEPGQCGQGRPADLSGPPRRAATLAAREGPALAGQPPPARGGSGDQLAQLGGSAPPPPPQPPPPALLPSAAASAGPGRAQPFPAAPRSAESNRTQSRRAGQDGPGRARPPGPAAGMGALARALLWPLLAQWLLRAAPALAAAPFTLPLRVAAATGRGVAPTPGPGPPAVPRADGLAFALEPAGGAANFLAMVDNLQGDSGRGYYLEVLIGTPPQKVGLRALARPPGPTSPPTLQSSGCSRGIWGGP